MLSRHILLARSRARLPRATRWIVTEAVRPAICPKGKAKAVDPIPQVASRASLATQRPPASDVPLGGERSNNTQRQRNEAIEHFVRLGLSPGLSKQLIDTYPLICRPTEAQEQLIPSILAPQDVLLRAHTGSGKSFGLLLALMAKPRILIKDDSDTSSRVSHGVASLVIVPSNELAAQYVHWAKALLPKSMSKSQHLVIQALVRGDGESAPEQQLDRLAKHPPHILVATPKRALEVLQMQSGDALLGISTLRTLVLDEVDALLDLPGRFPHQKVIWKNLQHPPAGLKFLNEVMKVRSTFSGGPPMDSQGYEGIAPKSRSREDRAAYHKKQATMKRSPNYSWLAKPKQASQSLVKEHPLQVVACSASANAVLRNFLGAKTGWVRMNVRADAAEMPRRRLADRESGTKRPILGKWLDLTGLSRTSHSPTPRLSNLDFTSKPTAHDYDAHALSVMPSELSHSCIVLDEGAPNAELSPMRNLSSNRVRRAMMPEKIDVWGLEKENINASDVVLEGNSPTAKSRSVVTPWAVPGNEVDVPLLEALAYVFATQGVERGIAFIPARWSLRAVQSELQQYGVPVVSFEELQAQSRQPTLDDQDQPPALCVLQATSARGLDIPHLDHVFLLGLETVGDTVRYTHLAGRASRLSVYDEQASKEQSRPQGRVITLVRGLSAEDQVKQASASPDSKASSDAQHQDWVASSELRMDNLYKRLGIRPQKLRLRPLAEAEENLDASADPGKMRAEAAA